MLEKLLIHKPDDPIDFMITHLKQDNDDGECVWETVGGSSDSLWTIDAKLQLI